jgi:hypothetical protein
MELEDCGICVDLAKRVSELKSENKKLKALLFDCQFCVDSESLCKEISAAIVDYEAELKSARKAAKASASFVREDSCESGNT